MAAQGTNHQIVATEEELVFIIREDSLLRVSKVYPIGSKIGDAAQATRMKELITHFMLHGYCSDQASPITSEPITGAQAMMVLVPSYTSVFAGMLNLSDPAQGSANFWFRQGRVKTQLISSEPRLCFRPHPNILRLDCTAMDTACAQPDIDMYQGFAIVEGLRATSVVIKMSNHTEANERLRHEALIYRHLRGIRGIPKYYGLFKFGSAVFLVISYAGKAISGFHVLTALQRYVPPFTQTPSLRS